jgi:hypothetical protein
VVARAISLHVDLVCYDCISRTCDEFTCLGKLFDRMLRVVARRSRHLTLLEFVARGEVCYVHAREVVSSRLFARHAGLVLNCTVCRK